MKLRIVALACVAALGGCAKVDKDICWKQETKNSVAAVIGGQSAQIKEGVSTAVSGKNINATKPLEVNMSSSDYSLERIDNDTGVVDCSMKLSIEVPYTETKSLKSEGKVFFSSREGEHGRYIEVSKTNIGSIASELN